MKRALWCIIAALALALALAPRAAPAAEPVAIEVTSNGWHSGIAIRRADIPAGRMPELADFADARIFIFGWGDAEFYQTPDPGIAMHLRAALQPTPAVLHIDGIAGPPREIYPSLEVHALALSERGFAALIDYLDASFARDGRPRIAAVGPGLHGIGKFYPATGSFHLFNTCNTWTARGLQIAGAPVQAGGVTTAEELMEQLRPR